MNLELVTLLYYRDIGYARINVFGAARNWTDFSSGITYLFRDKLCLNWWLSLVSRKIRVSLDLLNCYRFRRYRFAQNKFYRNGARLRTKFLLFFNFFFFLDSLSDFVRVSPESLEDARE